VLVWSASASRSDFVDLEWTIAVATKRPICILSLDGTQLPPTLASIQVHRPCTPKDAADWLATALPKHPRSGEVDTRRILEKLGSAGTAPPAALAHSLRTAFTHSMWNVSGDVHVHFGDSTQLSRQRLLIWGGSLAAIVAGVYGGWGAIESRLPLATRIAGVVIDSTSKSPVEGATVRILTAGGMDITGPESVPITDSNGVFFVVAARPLRRNAKVLIQREGCKSEMTSLSRHFEAAVPESLPYVDRSTKPFFRLESTCER